MYEYTCTWTKLDVSLLKRFQSCLLFLNAENSDEGLCGRGSSFCGRRELSQPGSVVTGPAGVQPRTYHGLFTSPSSRPSRASLRVCGSKETTFHTRLRYDLLLMY